MVVAYTSLKGPKMASMPYCALGSIRQGKAELTYIILLGEAKMNSVYQNSVFHHLPSVGPKQLCALSTPRMYSQSLALHSGKIFGWTSIVRILV